MWLLASAFGALIALAGGAWQASEAHANGRPTEYARKLAGPYEIALAPVPAPTGVGNVHLTVTVVVIGSTGSVTGASVVVTGAGPEGTGLEMEPLTLLKDPTDPARFDGDIALGMEGSWTLTIAVASGLADAAADFAVDVKRSGPAFGLVTFILLVVIALLMGLSARLRAYT